MFRKFDPSTDIAGRTQVKSSVVRNIRTKLVQDYPGLEPVLDEILPKKGALTLIKCREHISILTNQDKEILFFQHYDDAFHPHLRLVHKYPNAFPTLRVDRGAIKFVLNGADIMCPGLTSPGALGDEEIPDIPAERVVVITAQGKEHALAVGFTKMSARDMVSINKGIGVENVHSLGDPLWNFVP
ncbi:translation machinery-associated protein 20 [Saitoella coloradoensis]